MTDQLQLADLGLADSHSCHLDPAHAVKVAATLDAPPVGPGDALPSLWHWAFFTPTVPSGQLGEDGHPSLTSRHLVAHPRRMWGAGRVEWTNDLTVGDPAVRTSRIARARHTEGRSGPLLLVTLEHTVRSGGQIALLEEQSLVYRTSGEPVPVPADQPFDPVDRWSEDWNPSPQLLFRFSAVTFNAHRIHYDERYAREVEGYPALVVHGPLTAIRLAGFVERRLGARLAWFGFKAIAPLFVGRSARLVVDPVHEGGNESTARVLRNDGQVAIGASFGLRQH